MARLRHISRATEEEKSLRMEVALCWPIELWSGKTPGDYLGHSLLQLPNQ